MPHTESVPRIAYSVSGPESAPFLVFVNGLGGAQAAFLHQVRHFSESRQVLTYDHRGIGRSDLVDCPAHMADFAADLIRLLDELAIEKADFVGLSFGGRVLLQLVAGWPERVGSLVIGGTSAGGALHEAGEGNTHRTLRAARGGSEQDWAVHIAPLLFGRQYCEQHPERLRSLAKWKARYPTHPIALDRQWEAWDNFDLGDQLGEINCPILVLHGTDDRLSPMVNAQRLAEHLPNAELQFMEAVGHSPNVEAPVAFNGAIEGFLQKS